MTKYLTKKLFMKKHLYHLRMLECTSLHDHLDVLNKILLDLCNVEVRVEEWGCCLNFVDVFAPIV